MKKSYVFVLSALLFAILAGFISKDSNEDCYVQIEKILQPFVSIKGNEMYLKYSNQLIVDGKYNQAMMHEMVVQSGKSKFQDEVVCIYEYGGKQISILKDRKLIVIQNVIKKVVLAKAVNPASLLAKDTLAKYYSNVSCGKRSDGIAYIDLSIKQKYTQTLPYDKITIEYKPHGMKYLRSIIHLRKASGGEEVKEIVEIIQFNSHPKGHDLPEDIMNTIYTAGKLKPEYKGYQVKNLSK